VTDRCAPRPENPPTTPCSRTLDVAAVSYQIVLTKGDQVPAKELETRLADTAAAIKSAPPHSPTFW